MTKWPRSPSIRNASHGTAKNFSPGPKISPNDSTAYSMHPRSGSITKSSIRPRSSPRVFTTLHPTNVWLRKSVRAPLTTVHSPPIRYSSPLSAVSLVCRVTPHDRYSQSIPPGLILLRASRAIQRNTSTVPAGAVSRCDTEVKSREIEAQRALLPGRGSHVGNGNIHSCGTHRGSRSFDGRRLDRRG
jgi:hypothetical protein